MPVRHPKQYQARYRQSGQGLTEYGLIICLVCILAIGALMSLGQGATDTLAGLTNSNNPSGTASSSLEQPPGSGTGGGAPVQNLPKQQAGGLAITLSSGNQIVVNQYPEDIKNSIATSGANGTTSKLLGTLDSVIQQLADSGQLTPEQASSLMALANQGHKIGGAVGIVENAVFGEKYWQPVTYDGVTYANPSELKNLFGYREGEGPWIADMQSLYAQAAASGALNDPVAREVVHLLTEQIANVANGVETSAQKYLQGEGEFNDLVVTHLTERDEASGQNTQTSLYDLPSAIIHDDSTQICQTGQGQDTGTHCQS